MTVLYSVNGQLLTRAEVRRLKFEEAGLSLVFGHGRRGAIEPGSAWLLTDAQDEIAEMNPHLHALGWYCALSGSTLYAGRGRDLDLLFVPVFSDASDRDTLVKILSDRWGGQIVDRHLSTTDRVLQVVWEDRDMRLIDAMFWRTADDELRVPPSTQLKLEDEIEPMGG